MAEGHDGPTASSGGQPLDRPGSYPARRPDFEPPDRGDEPAGRPPDGERPAPGPDRDGAGGRAGDDPAHPPSPRPRGDRRWGRGLSLGLALTAAVVVAALGAVIGSLATLRYADRPPRQEAVPAPAPQDQRHGSGLPKATSVAGVASSLLPSVVQVTVRTGTGRVTGSGLVMNRKGHILTNNHVVEPATGGGTIQVVLGDGRTKNATVVGRSPAYDLAVLHVEGGEELTPATFGDSAKVRVGQPVVAIGSPLDLAGTVTSGIVSALDRPVSVGHRGETSFINAIQTDAAINPGNSGGPLANLKAEVIGVNSAIATIHSKSTFTREEQGNIGLGFAVPINQARRTADQIIRTGHAVYPVLGATIDLGYGGRGARIVQVQPGSAAAGTDLESGDVITVIDGHRVRGPEDLIVQIRRHRPGQDVELTYRGDGDEDRVRVTLGKQIG